MACFQIRYVSITVGLCTSPYNAPPIFLPPHSFSKSVTFDGNRADSGAAFAVLEGSLTFEKPEVVRFRNGETDDNQFSVRASDRTFR